MIKIEKESAIPKSMISIPSLDRVHPVARGGKCSKGKASSIAAKMPSKISICTKKAEWMSPLLNGSLKNIPIIVTVGCNLADAFLVTMREWSRNSTYSLHSMQPHYAKLPSYHLCPQPDDPKIDDAKPRPVRGFCVEPVHSTAKVLRRAFRELGWDSEITLIETIVSSSKGKPQSSKAPAGNPDVGRGHLAKLQNTHDAHITTLDELAAKHAIPSIDVLSINTAGNIIRVISGGSRTLPRARQLDFEHHSINHRTESDLHGAIDRLDQLGFDCFRTGSKGELFRLTGCWHGSYYKTRGWSRVACANRREPGAALLAAMTRAAARSGASWDIPPLAR